MEMIDTSELSVVRETVQHNCAISDARFARDYSLCIYLLRMREFYRWKERIEPGVSIDADALGTWVNATETHWDTVEETDFLPLHLNGKVIEPFDTATINTALADTGLVYSAGIGRFGQPHFVLAKLHRQSTIEDVVCMECSDELARDTITMPAMTQGSTVFIRHQSLAQMLWQMLEEWRIKQLPGPMARLVAHHDIRFDEPLAKQITRVAGSVVPVLLHHELGERAAGELVGPDFTDLTRAFLGRRGEMQIRAVRDLLADTLRTWPFIMQQKAVGNLRQSACYVDFWLAGVSGYREVLLKQSPQAAAFLSDAESLSAEHRLAVLETLIAPEQQRWQQVAKTLITEYRSHGQSMDVEATIKHCASTWA